MNDVALFLARGIPPEMVETFTHLVFSPDLSDATLMIEQLFDDGVSPESVMLELLAPAARLMGDMWCGDEANFLDVTLGLSRIQHLMRQFRLPAFHPDGERGWALLVPVPGEQHCFGLRVVEEFLLRDGWRVRLAQVEDEADLRRLVAADAYDFVGFSISGVRLLPALCSAIREVRTVSRNRNTRIMVGGAIFAGEVGGVFETGADATVRDAREAVTQANRWYDLAGVA